MNFKVKKFGNSYGILLPKKMAEPFVGGEITLYAPEELAWAVETIRMAEYEKKSAEISKPVEELEEKKSVSPTAPVEEIVEESEELTVVAEEEIPEEYILKPGYGNKRNG